MTVAGSKASVQYEAPPIMVDPVETECSDARKIILRVLDTKIAQLDGPMALTAIRMASKLATNIIAHPGDPKFLRIKVSNPALQRSLGKVIGGQELLLAMGFRTVVEQFEEYWSLEPTPLAVRILEAAREGFLRYEQSIEARAEQKARVRQETVSGTNAHREQILREIEADKADRRQRSQLMSRACGETQQVAPADA